MPPKNQCPNDEREDDCYIVSSRQISPAPQPSRPLASTRAHPLALPRHLRVKQPGQAPPPAPVPQCTKGQAKPDAQPSDRRKSTRILLKDTKNAPTSSNKPVSTTQPSFTHPVMGPQSPQIEPLSLSLLSSLSPLFPPLLSPPQLIASEYPEASGSGHHSHGQDDEYPYSVGNTWTWFGTFKLTALFVAAFLISFSFVLRPSKSSLNHVDPLPQSFQQAASQNRSTFHTQVLQTVDVLKSYPSNDWEAVLAHIRPLAQQHATQRETSEGDMIHSTLKLALAAKAAFTNSSDTGCRNELVSHVETGISAVLKASTLAKDASRALSNARSVFKVEQKRIFDLEAGASSYSERLYYQHKLKSRAKPLDSIFGRPILRRMSYDDISRHLNATYDLHCHYLEHQKRILDDLHGIKGTLLSYDTAVEIDNVAKKAEAIVLRWIEKDEFAVAEFRTWLSRGSNQSCPDKSKPWSLHTTTVVYGFLLALTFTLVWASLAPSIEFVSMNPVFLVKWICASLVSSVKWVWKMLVSETTKLLSALVSAPRWLITGILRILYQILIGWPKKFGAMVLRLVGFAGQDARDPQLLGAQFRNDAR